MIYVKEIDVPYHVNWGDIHSVETILPSDIHHITAIFANVVPYDGSHLKRYVDIENDKKRIGDILSAQIGNISVTLNLTDILLDASPLCELSKQEKSSMNMNRIVLPDNGVNVEYGSTLRIIIEEMETCPYVQDVEEWKLYPEYNSLDDVELNSNYVVKLYIEYDR